MTTWHKTLSAFACSLILATVCPAAAQEKTVLNIYSATDTNAIAPLIEQFEQSNPDIAVAYTEFNTSELYDALIGDKDAAQLDVDVVISSAMDLQVKLVNEGMAHAFSPANAQKLPFWAQWRNELFGFTFEPVAVVYSKAAFKDHPLPRTRSELSGMVRDEPEFFNGRIGTYDIRLSGVGYLFATQDAQRGYQFSRLTESFGRARTKIYCCTYKMMDAIRSGELVIGYNAIGSYALNVAREDDSIGIYLLDDYTLVMSRTVFVPKSSRHKSQAMRFVDFLLSPAGQKAIAEHSLLLPIASDAVQHVPGIDTFLDSQRPFIPIRLGPGLLTYLDGLKKDAFLNDWAASMDTAAPK